MNWTESPKHEQDLFTASHMQRKLSSVMVKVPSSSASDPSSFLGQVYKVFVNFGDENFGKTRMSSVWKIHIWKVIIQCVCCCEISVKPFICVVSISPKALNECIKINQ